MPDSLSQGIDRIDLTALKDRRIALITNHTAVDKQGIPTISRLQTAGLSITAIFSLEHGYFPVAQDMESVGTEQKLCNVPVLSLYGDHEATLSPDQELFGLFDTVIYDVQDIGSRYYTYIQSLTLFMDALEKTPRELIVLDRVNPIGGAVEGSVLEEKYQSFVGRFPLPHRHGFTTGEAAQYYYTIKGYSFPFTVIYMEGWKRDRYFDQWSLCWIPTSPNMPTLDTALLYPGACLIEGTELSEGRGTTFPFHFTGAPGVNPFMLADTFNLSGLPGVTALPLECRPMFQKHAMRRCGGIYLTITDRNSIKPLRTFIAIVNLFRDLLSDVGFFRAKPYEFVADIPAIELLLGDKKLIDMFYRKASFTEIDAYLTETETAWEKQAAPFKKY